MTEQRTLIRWTLEDNNADFRKYVIDEALLIAGGCTVLFGQGWWIHGADVKQDMYHGEKEESLVFILEVVSEHKDAAHFLRHMKHAITYAATEYHVDIDWVHVTTSWTQLNNFSVAEDLVA